MTKIEKHIWLMAYFNNLKESEHEFGAAEKATEDLEMLKHIKNNYYNLNKMNTIDIVNNNLKNRTAKILAEIFEEENNE